MRYLLVLFLVFLSAATAFSQDIPQAELAACAEECGSQLELEVQIPSGHTELSVEDGHIVISVWRLNATQVNRTRIPIRGDHCVRYISSVPVILEEAHCGEDDVPTEVAGATLDDMNLDGLDQYVDPAWAIAHSSEGTLHLEWTEEPTLRQYIGTVRGGYGPPRPARAAVSVNYARLYCDCDRYHQMVTPEQISWNIQYTSTVPTTQVQEEETD